jgi:hypothetical protein
MEKFIRLICINFSISVIVFCLFFILGESRVSNFCSTHFPVWVVVTGITYVLSSIYCTPIILIFSLFIEKE